MPKRLLPLTLIFAALAAVAAYGAWAFYRASERGFGWAGAVPVAPYLLTGALSVGAVLAVFLWLAGSSGRGAQRARAGSAKP